MAGRDGALAGRSRCTSRAQTRPATPTRAAPPAPLRVCAARAADGGDLGHAGAGRRERHAARHPPQPTRRPAPHRYAPCPSPTLPAARAAASAPDARAARRARGDAPGGRRLSRRGARDYRDAITTIVTLHYEEKKKAILGGLDREIAIEKDELKKARETAIKRLEDFVAKYSGANAQPEATPDAMYRLAALYEERARSRRRSERRSRGRASSRPSRSTSASSASSRSTASSRASTTSSATRSTTRAASTRRSRCGARSSATTTTRTRSPPDPKDPDADTVVPLPQDHDEAYWTAWRSKYHDAEVAEEGAEGRHDVTTIRIPRDCAAIPQPTLRRARSRSTSPRSGGASATGSSTSSTCAGGVRRRTSRRRSGTTTARRAPTRTRCSSRSRRSTASRSTSTRGRSSSSSATRPRRASSSTCSTTPTSKRS